MIIVIQTSFAEEWEMVQKEAGVKGKKRGYYCNLCMK